ncbi:MAG: ABC transporter permease [Rhodothermales bacterium]|nr:ABC transporter permease [Rhodothermales bacterium]
MKTASYVNLMGVLVLITVVFGWTTEHFFTVRTFQTIANQLPALIVVAVGMTFVLGIAGIDLSVGSVLALGSSVLGVLLVDAGAPLWVGMAASLGVGLLCGLASGYVAVRWSIPSFIVTLGMLEIARGAAYLVTGSQTKYIGAAVSGLGEPLPFIGLSAAFLVALLVAAGGHVALTRTVFGRYVLAVGGNLEATRLAGVDIRKVQIAVFALAGLLSGLGGVFQTAYLGSADPNAGTGMELAAIAAVVIGGTSLMGGRASVINSFLGVLIIAFLQSGLAQVGASDPTKRVVTGAVIIAAVLVDVFRQKRRAGPSV